ncbi:MAG: HEAT repeat domain-containing protein [PVC group bacterium]|nr:HEAT repeat domain-containing protein [PVC group bacterium]
MKEFILESPYILPAVYIIIVLILGTKGLAFIKKRLNVKHQLKKISEKLKDVDWRVRESAIQDLIYMEQYGIEMLLRILRKSNYSNLRWKAAEALGVLRADKAVEALIQSMCNDSEETVCSKAAKALSDIGEKAVPVLIDIIKTGDMEIRERTFVVLIKIGEPAATSLISMLTYTDSDMRWRVIKALGEIMDPRAVPGLIKVLKNKKMGEGERCLAAQGLGKIADESAVTVLKKASEDENDYVREAAVKALQMIKMKKK